MTDGAGFYDLLVSGPTVINQGLVTEPFSGENITFNSPYPEIDFYLGTTYSTGSPDSSVPYRIEFFDLDGSASFSTYTPLFTENSDTVNFDVLLPAQVTAIEDGADLYHTLDGNDTVTLPTIANASNLGGSGVAYEDTIPLVLGDGTDAVYGSDAPTNISVGTGADTVYLQNGEATFSFSSSTGALILVPSSMVLTSGITASISNFSSGNVIDFPGEPDLTTSAAFLPTGESRRLFWEGARGVAHFFGQAKRFCKHVGEVAPEFGTTC